MFLYLSGYLFVLFNLRSKELSAQQHFYSKYTGDFTKKVPPATGVH